MKRLAALALLTAACNGGSARQYDNNDLQLVTGYAAKEMCSCLFVMEMPLDYCTAWTKQPPSVARFSIDFDRKTVESTALLQWGSRAHLDGDKFGCVFDE